MQGGLDLSLIVEDLSRFIIAFRLDVFVAVLGYVIAMGLGLPVAALARSRNRALRGITFVYVQLMRGVPPFVFLYWVYFGLASELAISMTPFRAALVALGLAGSGYTAEIFRTGIAGVDPGQIEAARALGLSWRHLYVRIVLPQAMRVMIPPLASVLIIMLQWSTLISVISIPDMLYVAKQSMMRNFRPFEGYVAITIIMIVCVSCLSRIVRMLELRFGARA